MNACKKIIATYKSLKRSEKFNFLVNFNLVLDLELASFFLDLIKDDSCDDDLRIEAVKIIGLYKGDYDDRFIINNLIEIINTDEEDSLIVHCINTLSLMNIGDKEIKFALNIIQKDSYILFKGAAFSLISHNKHIPSAIEALRELLNDIEYRNSAIRELA